MAAVHFARHEYRIGKVNACGIGQLGIEDTAAVTCKRCLNTYIWALWAGHINSAIPAIISEFKNLRDFDPMPWTSSKA